LLDVADRATEHTTATPVEQIRAEALAEAQLHALLALAPRRARRQRRDHEDPPTAGPRHRWLYPDGRDQ
jgi:hypothetical protein